MSEVNATQYASDSIHMTVCELSAQDDPDGQILGHQKGNSIHVIAKPNGKDHLMLYVEGMSTCVTKDGEILRRSDVLFPTGGAVHSVE